MVRNKKVVVTKQLAISHRVVFLGIRMDVQLVQMADIAIVSSKYEGFSLFNSYRGQWRRSQLQRVML
jgi:hypothetical protein